MNEHLKTAYVLGAQAAARDFEKLSYTPGSRVPGMITPPAKPPAPSATQPRAAAPMTPRTPAAPARSPAPAQKAPEMTMQQYSPGTKQYQQAMRQARTAPPPTPAGQAERQAYRSRSAAISAMQAEQAKGGLSAERAKYWGNVMKGF